MSESDAESGKSSRAPRPEAAVERRPKLDVSVQLRLGIALARYADAFLSEPAPDAFLTLLAKLEAKEANGE